MSLESIKFVCEILALFAVGVSVVAGSVALVVGNRINKAQAKQLREFELALNVQKERTARAELALLELQQSLAPRGLTIAQGNALVAALKPFANQKFLFVTYQDDREAMHFCEVINEVLQGAGWKIEKSNGFLAFSLEFGVSVMVDPKADRRTQAAATALIAALNSQGVATKVYKAGGDTKRTDLVSVRVGKKP